MRKYVTARIDACTYSDGHPAAGNLALDRIYAAGGACVSLVLWQANTYTPYAWQCIVSGLVPRICLHSDVHDVEARSGLQT